ncbi:MAG: hypothetical protein FWD84_00990 [Oscillospiraceae bacterium]|nr:hypothetical protein [Oscillospiraceae bacterium]
MKKQKKWSNLKDGIIMYLAISKIMYWIGTFGEMAQNGFENAGMIFLERVLSQDLPLILVIVCIVIIESSKANFWIKNAMGYVAYNGILFAYFVATAWIFGGDPAVGAMNFGGQFLGFTIQFIIIGVILHGKEHGMKKLKE